MKIITFSSIVAAQKKLNEYNDLARHATSSPDFTLTKIEKHTVRDEWWFNADNCINNGGLGRDQIAQDVAKLKAIDFADTQALIDAGYLRPPEHKYPSS